MMALILLFVFSLGILGIGVGVGYGVGYGAGVYEGVAPILMATQRTETLHLIVPEACLIESLQVASVEYLTAPLCLPSEPVPVQISVAQRTQLTVQVRLYSSGQRRLLSP